MNTRSGVLFVSLLLTGFPTSAFAQWLSGPALNEAIGGKTLSAKPGAMTIKVTFHKDGQLVGKAGLMRLNGTWSIEGDMLCMDMRRARGEMPSCQSFQWIEDKTLLGSNGMLLHVID